MQNEFQTGLFGEDVETADAVMPAHGSASVLVPYPVDKAYDYAVPDGITLEPGAYVTVPLGKKQVEGIVWDSGESDANPAPRKLKTLISRHDVRPLPAAHRKFIDWVAAYTLTPRGAVLKMTLGSSAALDPPKGVTAYTLAPPSIGGGKFSPAQNKVLDLLADGHPRRASEITQQCGASPAVIKGLADKGYIDKTEIAQAAPCRNPDWRRNGPDLSEAQKEAAATLKTMLAENTYRAVMIDGVTGAGKTEVYFEAIAAVLESGRQALIMLPEIALSNAFVDRFKSRFGCAPALWHSNLGPGQRKAVWRGVAEGQTRVVAGARSALFLPYADLSLIVVDEEHDPAYKQEEGIIYNARDMAVVRAHLGNIPVALASATPSLETMHNVWTGRYSRIHLPDRFGGAQLPEINTIDMRAEKLDRGNFIAPTLKNAMIETLQAGEQVLLFLNRRGYAPLTLCRACGHRMECPRCTAWLIEHKRNGSLCCHHCGFQTRTPAACPSCAAPGSLAACGPGVERIYEEAHALFPDARLMMLASDTAQDNQSLKDMLEKIRSREVDIVVGTQIIAKGHHFPGLTCVGVIDADLGLQGGELRAAERTYQLLHQVAGRAGREQKKGRVYLQTWMPEHKIIRALAKGGRDEFLEAEAYEREQANMPPYSRLAGIIVSGREESAVVETAKELGRIAPQGPDIQTLGPAPAPMARLRGRHRHRLLVRAAKKVNIQREIDLWLGSLKIPSAVRVQVDIDPQSFV